MARELANEMFHGKKNELSFSSTFGYEEFQIQFEAGSFDEFFSVQLDPWENNSRFNPYVVAVLT